MNPASVADLFEALAAGDAKRMALAVRTIEQISVTKPALIQPHKGTVLRIMGRMENWIVRSRVCLILPRLRLTSAERREAFDLVGSYGGDASSVVRTFAMQAMFDLSAGDDAMRDDAARVIERALAHGTPAMRARARMLSKRLGLA